MARKSATQPPRQAGPTRVSEPGATPLPPAVSAVSAHPAAAGAAAAAVPSGAAPRPAVFSAPPRSTAAAREYVQCDLCGQPLGRDVGHFHMVSPLTARRVSVCRTCRRAALSEGYRPRS
jgi:hypothetical protein